MMGVTTGFVNSSGVDVGISLVERSYLIDRYPGLADNFRFAGVWLWGRNSQGRLGDNTVTSASSPIQTIAGGANWTTIGASAAASAGIKSDGTLWDWGSAYNLGNNNNISHRSSPVQTVAGGTNWKQVAQGSSYTLAIKTDGTLWSWGSNTYGSLGDNTASDKSSPVQTVASGTNWKAITCGDVHTLAIKTDGTLWGWGRNDYGQLGNNAVTNISSPVQTVSGGTNWRLAVGGTYYTAAIKTDGTLWLWGRNFNGALGDNSTTNRSSPVQTVAGGTNWKQVACGQYTTLAIKTDGTLWTWGYNVNGSLGDNTVTSKSSPVQTISGGTNWKMVTNRYYTSAAIKTDGTLWLWGNNPNGEIGDLTITKRSSPVQTVSGGTNWVLVVAGKYHTVAIRDNSNDYL